MGWRYRKRIKILPGIHLNISKSGISTNIGVKGANVTAGQKGTYVNTGIPGTGLYRRDKIGGDGTNNESISQTNTTMGLSATNKTNSSDKGCLYFLSFLCLTACQIILPVHIAYCIIKNITINYPTVVICAAIIIFASLYYYKNRNQFKKLEDVKHWLYPIYGVLLFWLFCSIGMAIIHTIMWGSDETSFNFIFIINVIVSFLLYSYVGSKSSAGVKLLKTETDQRLKKANIAIFSKLANESRGYKRIFFYGELLSNGGEVETLPYLFIRKTPMNVSKNVKNALLVFDTDYMGVKGTLNSILTVSPYTFSWVLLSFTKNYKGYYYNTNIRRERKYFSFDSQIFNHVTSTQNITSFEIDKKVNYLYPLFWIIAEDSVNFELLSLKDVRMEIEEIHYIETDEKIIAGNKQKEKVDIATVNGKKYPVYKYALIRITSQNKMLDYTLVHTRYIEGKMWVDSFNDYKTNNSKKFV